MTGLWTARRIRWRRRRVRRRRATVPRLLVGPVVAGLAAAGLVVGSVTVLPPMASAATQTVTNCKNSGTGSLRQAVSDAASGDTVTFALAPSCSIIALTAPIDIDTDVTIEGPGPSTLTVREFTYKDVFVVSSAVTAATIAGITIKDGSTGIDNEGALTVTGSTVSDNGSNAGGGIDNDGGTLTVDDSTVTHNSVGVTDGAGGGGIDNEGGQVSVTDSTVSDNVATSGADGGGIDNDGGSLVVTDSTVSGNSTSDGSGGAIDVDSGAVTVTDSTVADNSSAYGGGGGIDIDSGTVTVADSTLAHNTAYYSVGGGGAYNGGTLDISNSTFFANSATSGGEGGGIFTADSLAITNSTLSGNRATNGGVGGIYNTATATVAATIVADSTAGGDCSGGITDAGYNLDDDGTCGFTAGTDFSDRSAGLDLAGPQANGGPTRTIALDAGSPALGAVTDATLCSSPDQRGVTRPTPCDIGSVQLAVPAPAITSPAVATATVGKPFSFTVTTTGAPVPSITKTGKLPGRLRFTSNADGTATVSGTPRRAGISSVTITATFGRDTDQAIVMQVLTVTVVG
jgi:hypothetical protein